MTARDDLDRHLAAWFAADAASREPEHLLGSVLARTARTRRRPAWLIPERLIPMSAITSTVPAPRIPWRLLAAAALLILALAVGALLVVGSQQRELPAPFGPAANGLVAYAADGDIYTVDPVTGASRAVVTDPATDRDPVWSLDGTRFVFLQLGEGGMGLHAARADGRDLTPITPEPLRQIEGYSFSPDGRSLLFSHLNGTTRSLAIAESDGSGIRPLDVGFYAQAPTFRPPNGTEILFIGGGSLGDSGLYVINADGTDLRALIEFSSSRHIGEARYSPDGSRIAYYYWDDAPAFTVRTHVMSADGTGDRLVDRQSDALWDAGVAWSNDGTRLAIVRGYTESGYGDTRAAVIPVDGSGPGVETDPSVSVNDECCATYAWSPDDTSILWTPVDALGRSTRQLLIDPNTGRARPAPWTASSDPTWQRVAP
jgi:Tol biopolymer transport system component